MMRRLPSYLWSVPPIVGRGIWAGAGLIALFGLFHLPALVRYSRADGRLRDLGVVVWPIVALFIVNSLLTSNSFWLNPLLPFLYSYAIAYVAAGL